MELSHRKCFVFYTLVWITLTRFVIFLLKLDFADTGHSADGLLPGALMGLDVMTGVFDQIPHNMRVSGPVKRTGEGKENHPFHLI